MTQHSAKHEEKNETPQGEFGKKRFLGLAIFWPPVTGSEHPTCIKNKRIHGAV